MRKKITLCITLLFITTSALADIRSVPGSYTTIQEAIDNCNDGDVVIVDPGVYYENINFLGKNIVVTGTDPEDPNIIAATIIDGNNNGSVVIFENGESTDAVLTGFTITGGSGTCNHIVFKDYAYYFGGGIFISASGKIEYNKIINNAITPSLEYNYAGVGVGICVWSLTWEDSVPVKNNRIDSVIIRNNTISNNSIIAGSEICAVEMEHTEYILFENNIVEENFLCAAHELKAPAAAIGIWWVQDITISNNIIRGNIAKSSFYDEAPFLYGYGGGGIYSQYCSPINKNNLIIKN